MRTVSSNYLYTILLVALVAVYFSAAEEEGQHGSAITGAEDLLNDTALDAAEAEDHQEETEAFYAVLFPSFSVSIGVVVFWLLSRYAHALPFTAVMFLIGTVMGIAVELNDKDNHLHETLRIFSDIDSHILLLVFLPGLIFKDAYGQNVHLFGIALGQCLIFAFPMVLAGTTLTALIARFVFPYDWNFNLCMTFGAILSATDPVAVAALLEQVGAPPRLKVHIAGEALLNDGAAIVFFDIFVDRYLYDIGIRPHNVDIAEGFALFFRKSLGAVAIGMAFGLVLLTILYILGNRFNREENVVEVSATIGVAYLNYYVAEMVCETSGVLATVALGVMTKFVGRPMINDPKLLEDFWTLVEHLLNTVLFTLGGVVFGSVVTSGEQDGSFTVRDYGFLLLLYILLHCIRFLLFAIAYPVTSRIGLKTNMYETIFQVYGGLRGAVGIALALALDSEVQDESRNPQDREDTRFAFAYVGGVAFLTLVINGTTAGPLLKYMGLADSTETREKIVRAFQTRFVTSAIDDMVRLLTQPRFKNINFALVKHHVPYLKDITRAQLMEAVEKHKDTTRPEDYFPPHLKKILPYLPKEADEQATDTTFLFRADSNDEENKMEFDPELHAKKMKRVLRTKNRMKRRQASTMRVMMKEEGDSLSLQELRGLYISLLKAAYESQIQQGELEAREFLSVALQASLDFALDAVQRGEPLRDWDYVHLVDGSILALGKSRKTRMGGTRFIEAILGKQARDGAKLALRQLNIDRSLAFMAAHRFAQQFMQAEFENADYELSELGKRVFNESQEQYRKAQEVLLKYPREEVEVVVSHKFCLILLNCGVTYISHLLEHGLLKEQEAEHLVEEIEEHILHVLSCNETEHPGELPPESFPEEDGIRGPIMEEETGSRGD